MNKVLWIAIAVLVCALMLPVLSKWLAPTPRLLRGTAIWLFILYILINLCETLLFRESSHDAIYMLAPFWSYRAALSLYEPGRGFGLFITDVRLFRQIILNILLYVPFGYLLPFAWPKLAQRKRPRPHGSGARRAFPWRVVLIGMAFSLTTECIQLVSRVGLFELDDIFDNTIGCVLGAGLYYLLIGRNKKPAEPA